MRRLILALVLILSFCFAVVINALARETVTINEINLSLNNSENAESESNNATEVDGVRFEIIAPERTWIIPEKKPKSETPISLGFRLTNLRSKVIHFSFIVPELGISDSEGEGLTLHGGRDITLINPDRTCRSLSPQQSITFFPNTKMLWIDGKLFIQYLDGIGGAWLYEVPQAGQYRVQFSYSDLLYVLCWSEKGEEFLSEAEFKKIAENYLINTIKTELIERSILEK